MNLMSLPYAKPIALFTGVGLTLGIGAGIAEWFRKPPQPEIRTERTYEAEFRQALSLVQEQQTRSKTQEERIATLTAQLQASTRQEQSGETKTTERIERYIPGPVSAAPATPVVVVGGQPQPVSAGVTGPQLAEVITRVVEATNRSKSEAELKRTSTAKVEMKAEAEMMATGKVEMKAEAEATEKGSEKVTIKPAEVAELPRFGAGYTSARQPFVSYDLTRGPRILGLQKVSVGVFATKASAGGGDGGPQLNLSLSKGKRLQPFVMGGYAVREQKTLIGVGVKF